jgi:hypothetical protein
MADRFFSGGEVCLDWLFSCLFLPKYGAHTPDKPQTSPDNPPQTQPWLAFADLLTWHPPTGRQRRLLLVVRR